ncbi:MAG: hypothetical protein A3C47_01925 [Omnitrophica bacterium RIFCSPHIGHO2_02_FULL_51_18]|nr:MAG: hypothetical protein A3C47_01925 [Omnitrophica bacterium RIFCSPHIGHO2_02_FULL_51_18]
MCTKFLFLMLAGLLLGNGLALVGCGNSGSEAVSEDKPSEDTVVERQNAGARPFSNGVFKTFKVYTDGNAPDNHYIPSGWMGDYGDLKYNDREMTTPHGGTTSIKITYNGKAAQGARWAGIYWQNPPNNWGTRPGGYDLTGAKKLTFWARGEKGGERIEEFKVGGITGEYADSDVAGIGPVVLTTDWQEFTIDLEGKDLSSISGGFCWATNIDVNPEGCVFYLDDIKYE